MAVLISSRIRQVELKLPDGIAQADYVQIVFIFHSVPAIGDGPIWAIREQQLWGGTPARVGLETVDFVDLDRAPM